jgi:hypothetical protein
VAIDCTGLVTAKKDGHTVAKASMPLGSGEIVLFALGQAELKERVITRFTLLLMIR